MLPVGTFVLERKTTGKTILRVLGNQRENHLVDGSLKRHPNKRATFSWFSTENEKWNDPYKPSMSYGFLGGIPFRLIPNTRTRSFPTYRTSKQMGILFIYWWKLIHVWEVQETRFSIETDPRLEAPFKGKWGSETPDNPKKAVHLMVSPDNPKKAVQIYWWFPLTPRELQKTKQTPRTEPIRRLRGHGQAQRLVGAAAAVHQGLKGEVFNPATSRRRE